MNRNLMFLLENVYDCMQVIIIEIVHYELSIFIYNDVSVRNHCPINVKYLLHTIKQFRVGFVRRD